MSLKRLDRVGFAVRWWGFGGGFWWGGGVSWGGIGGGVGWQIGLRWCSLHNPAEGKQGWEGRGFSESV